MSRLLALGRLDVWTLVLVACVALVPRALILWAPSATLVASGGAAGRHDFHHEEIHRANVAAELAGGMRFESVFDYQYTDFFGGALVTSLLAAPLFALFGETLLVLKLVPVGFHLAATLLLWAVLRRAFGRAPALGAGLLFAVGPPGYLALTTIAFGSHVESNALVALALFLFSGLHALPDARATAEPTTADPAIHRGRLRFALGLVLGFSVYFGYQTLLLLAALLVVDVALLRRSAARRLVPEVLGFAVGIAPWLAYNQRIGWTGLGIYGRDVDTGIVGADPARAVDAVTRLIPAVLDPVARLGTDGGRLGVIFAGAALVLALLGLTHVSRLGPSAPARERLARALTWVAAVHVALFAIACTRLNGAGPGDRPLPIRYGAIVAPSLVILVASGTAALRARPFARRIAAFGLAGALVAYGTASASLVSPARAGAFDRSVTSTRAFGLWLGHRLTQHPDLYGPQLEAAYGGRTAEDTRELRESAGQMLDFIEAEAGRPESHLRGSAEDVAVARAWLVR